MDPIALDKPNPGRPSFNFNPAPASCAVGQCLLCDSNGCECVSPAAVGKPPGTICTGPIVLGEPVWSPGGPAIGGEPAAPLRCVVTVSYSPTFPDGAVATFDAGICAGSAELGVVAVLAALLKSRALIAPAP